jgi:hypothetical protein
VTNIRDSKEGIIRTGPYPELTPTAILVGYGIGILITVSIGYASLILGFSIEGSEVAAILGFGILRGVLRRNSIIENNINQTVASAVNGASAGMMFTVPALFILGETSFSAVLMVFACIAGGILGIAFIIPLRKQMIDFERLTFPGGVAVATVLKSPGAGVKKALLLVSGMAASGLAHFITQYWHFENWNLGELIGMPDYMNGVWYLSLLTVGVAFIAGKGGFYFIVGGFVCYWILSPLLNTMGLLPAAEQLQQLDTTTPAGWRRTGGHRTGTAAHSRRYQQYAKGRPGQDRTLQRRNADSFLVHRGNRSGRHAVRRRRSVGQTDGPYARSLGGYLRHPLDMGGGRHPVRGHRPDQLVAFERHDPHCRYYPCRNNQRAR